MTVPQPVYEYMGPPELAELRERCELGTGEKYKTVVRSVRSAVTPDMLTYLAVYEIGKEKSLIRDEDIMTKVKERCDKTKRDYITNPSGLFSQQLKVDLVITDVIDRIYKYFRYFEKIIADYGLHENLGRESQDISMLELEKIRHIRISGQLLYKLILERAEMQQLLYSRFRQSATTYAGT
ncbi:uncharacterized protein PITG_13062 [Phytophthora infestans T30-4]|uniref:Uncharacterized protein n=1 Tax=Phytophthora infestans (strain T30-4) TaxID=403677 RepID=D0NK75_PHYIT|nr:uncharacterized protein PITG_13062 [Phytophthora infestans T30-4]EEY59912.1 conserved hypothetical protein [Phytophthora infestans T30-4]|eukprot:XP_002900597.1 conserved hypothetical protein [Phytophthora infestans T30-4]